jgi:hypothetical protein
MFGRGEMRGDWTHRDHPRSKRASSNGGRSAPARLAKTSPLGGENNGGWRGSGPSRSNTVRLGLNYHFNPRGAALIYAKY